MSTTSPGPSRSPRVQPAELRNIGLFGALPEAVLEHLASTLEIIEVPPGTYLFREDDPADCMFVVLQGDVEILKRSRVGADARVAVLGPRDWFGEMSIIDVQPRSATVLSVSPARLIKVTAVDLDRLYRFDVKAYALIVLNIAREMSRRLRVADGMMAELIANVDGWVRKRPD
ncbi:MAG TPA: cyclic nucleotide-binding domain-containing protein [Polyangiaceae bacterium]|nr:cyclic nucleotide-binding domain-containing protein [Polyangiaceae bacterium]